MSLWSPQLWHLFAKQSLGTVTWAQFPSDKTVSFTRDDPRAQGWAGSDTLCWEREKGRQVNSVDHLGPDRYGDICSALQQLCQQEQQGCANTRQLSGWTTSPPDIAACPCQPQPSRGELGTASHTQVHLGSGPSP